ncbi:hypothetical protein Runsl_3256 [Runella slithyformis DSM 19594]|uniref:Uncharacterized protein n=1 Tax=Runella slithyformis (strain ATCC 29530 / DSM 19594 / LMG 11500 / NCIMB 11436 / LSU 4) TaxID=761193 RepID=A0A7U3ZLX0_RUNSL|nr:hypothetical protein Runsl_3256 [Runella slithyformis DSM 19594]
MLNVKVVGESTLIERLWMNGMYPSNSSTVFLSPIQKRFSPYVIFSMRWKSKSVKRRKV